MVNSREQGEERGRKAKAKEKKPRERATAARGAARAKTGRVRSGADRRRRQWCEVTKKTARIEKKKKEENPPLQMKMWKRKIERKR